MPPVPRVYLYVAPGHCGIRLQKYSVYETRAPPLCTVHSLSVSCALLACALRTPPLCPTHSCSVFRLLTARASPCCAPAAEHLPSVVLQQPVIGFLQAILITVGTASSLGLTVYTGYRGCGALCYISHSGRSTVQHAPAHLHLCMCAQRTCACVHSAPVQCVHRAPVHVCTVHLCNVYGAR